MATVTGQQLVTRSLELIYELTPGETPNASESAAALIRLNALIDHYSIQQELATSATVATQALSNGVQSYALSTRVVKVVSAEVQQSSGSTMPLKVVDAIEWNALVDRDATSSYPQYLFYDRGYTTGTIYLSPIPTAGTLTYVAWAAQSTFATLSTSVNVVPGYERLLTTALAIELSPLYGRDISPGLKSAYVEAMGEVRKLNSQLWGLTPQNVGAAA